MKTINRSLAAVEILLIFPAALFMTALFVRNIEPLQLEPARSAARIVTWYSGHLHMGLWIFLMAMPFAVLVTGAASLMKSWKEDAELRSSARSASKRCARNGQRLWSRRQQYRPQSSWQLSHCTR